MSAPAVQPIRVLLLDDDEDEFVIAQGLLSRVKERYALEWTADPERALASMRGATHDVYLVDYRLGARSGVEVVSEAVQSGVKAPIILLTGQDVHDVDLEALRVGAADYLSKQGLSPHELDRSIRFARERARAAVLRDRLEQTVARSGRLEAAVLAQARSAERATKLQSLTAALSSALTSKQVAEHVVERGLPLLGASALLVAISHDGGETLELLAHKGYGDDVAQTLRALLEQADLPITKCVSSQRPSWEFAPVTPKSAAQARALVDLREASCLPLVVRGKTIGLIAFNYPPEHVFDDDERAVALTVSEVVAQALDRARLHETQQRTNANLAFLADVGTLLSSSLNDDEVLRQLARLVVPTLADWCSIDGVDPNPRGPIVHHADPKKLELARELQRRYPPDRDAPQGVYEVMRTGRAELYPTIPQQMLDQAAVDDEHRRLIRELGLRSALVVPLIARGRVLGAITLIYAESGRNYSQEDLQFAQELARRAALAVDNGRLYQDAAQAIRVRDEFLSIAGHELKTPLTALMIQTQGLAQQLSGVHPDAELIHRLPERLTRLVEHVRRLERLINELLDVSRITSGRLVLERELVDLGELTREVVARSADMLHHADCRVELVTEKGVRGHWDRLRLDQVLTNLLGNAAKYGRGKPIELSIRRVEGGAEVRVKDHGIGIAPENQQRIFDRFERAVSERHYGGFGLGLWIARQIVEASGGSIRVESVPGEGATFSVILPFDPPAASA